MPEASPPSLADIRQAAERLLGHAVRTPLLTHPELDRVTAARVLIKAETLQRTGSFKFRGAYNAICQIQRASVVAYSSGNHAQGVAAAAALRGVPAVIVMPSDAPRAKIAGTRSYGAEVVTYERYREVREEIGARLAAERDAELVKPYDDPRVIAGQGTVGLEIAEQAKAMDIVPDLGLVPCGGGGLIAGCALALKHSHPDMAIYCVEPDRFDDTARSLAAGTRLSIDPGGRSICDALLAPTPGSLTFEINRELLSGGLSVTDQEVRRAMAFAFRHLKLVVEPGGAVALAAALCGKLDIRGRTVALVLSGGNVDPGLYADAITDEA